MTRYGIACLVLLAVSQAHADTKSAPLSDYVWLIECDDSGTVWDKKPHRYRQTYRCKDGMHTLCGVSDASKNTALMWAPIDGAGAAWKDVDRDGEAEVMITPKGLPRRIFQLRHGALAEVEEPFLGCPHDGMLPQRSERDPLEVSRQVEILKEVRAHAKNDRLTPCDVLELHFVEAEVRPVAPRADVIARWKFESLTPGEGERPIALAIVTNGERKRGRFAVVFDPTTCDAQAELVIALDGRRKNVHFRGDDLVAEDAQGKQIVYQWDAKEKRWRW